MSFYYSINLFKAKLVKSLILAQLGFNVQPIASVLIFVVYFVNQTMYQIKFEIRFHVFFGNS
jgi:hypothetical protein